MNCGIGGVAKKINLLRQAQMIRAGLEIANRQPHPPTGALYLMQLREHPMRIHVPRMRREIAVETSRADSLPQTVKIIHHG